MGCQHRDPDILKHRLVDDCRQDEVQGYQTMRKKQRGAPIRRMQGER
jgi:hypothetical protein